MMNSKEHSTPSRTRQTRTMFAVTVAMAGLTLASGECSNQGQAYGEQTAKTPLAVAGPDAGKACPPTPAWLLGVTRVAYTDLGNNGPAGDWPEKVIADFAAAGVQMMFSRVHGGSTWDGLGWKSRYGDIPSAMKGVPVDWEIPRGGGLASGDVHSGQRCLRLVHQQGQSDSYLNGRWQPHNGQQGAMVSCLKGRLSYWYKVANAKDATIWLGAIPISGDPIENTGSKRTGVQLPAEHAGDGQWHQVTIDYDFTGNPAVKWLHTSCVISGNSAEVLLDDMRSRASRLSR